MNSILFLPCNNGLGHIRRLSILANKINSPLNKISFFLDSKKKINLGLIEKLRKYFF